MEDRLAVTQDEHGRWRWVAGHLGPASGRIAQGVVTFETKGEAEADFAIQANAPMDKAGRRVLEKEYLQRLIRAAAARCEECEDAYFGGVYWHQRDAAGCNWRVSTIGGADWKGCFDCIQPVAIQLRATFAIADEA